jgi:ferredoxin--NADP+ reductase
LSPQRFVGKGGRLEQIIFSKTNSFGNMSETQQIIAAGLVFSSIGYQVLPIPGIPFDEKHYVIPSLHGRVLNQNSPSNPNDSIPGLYVSGWAKRGPTGIIGTNIGDAKETVRSIIEDFMAGKLKNPILQDDIRICGDVQVVTKDGWTNIDRAELRQGEPRKKLLTYKDLLGAAGSRSSR